MSWKEYENEPTKSLIEYIQWQEQKDYIEIAKDAFKVFCFRFREDVIKKCRAIARNWGYDNQIGDLIAERTFDRFWKYPSSFNPSICKREIDPCIKFYLYKIAERQLADYKKEAAGEGTNPYLGDEEIIRDFPDIEIQNFDRETKNALKKKHEIVEKALARLSPKHKIIYLTYKVHEKNGYKMPRTLLKSLRTDLELTQASVQVYKKEAYDTINEYIKIYGAK